MSSVTPSTAFTVLRARPKRDPPVAGKWTLRARIEINGSRSASISFRLSTRRKPRLRNGRANGVRASVARTVETHSDKRLRHDHTAARTNTPSASAPDPAAPPDSHRHFPPPLHDHPPHAKSPASHHY